MFFLVYNDDKDFVILPDARPYARIYTLPVARQHSGNFQEERFHLTLLSIRIVISVRIIYNTITTRKEKERYKQIQVFKSYEFLHKTYSPNEILNIQTLQKSQTLNQNTAEPTQLSVQNDNNRYHQVQNIILSPKARRTITQNSKVKYQWPRS